MSRILAYCWALGGHLRPIMATVDALRERGHDVMVATYPPKVHRTSAASTTPAVHEFSLASKVRSGAEHLDALLAIHSPDALLIDSTVWGGLVSAECSGLPWAMMATTPIDLRGRGTDGRGFGLPPPTTRAMRLVDRIAGWQRDYLQAPLLDAINALRHERGLRRHVRAADRLLQAPLIIAFTAEPFEYPRDDWPSALRFVGPALDSGGSAHAADAAQGTPKILVSGSTHPSGARPSARLATAVALGLGECNFEVILTIPVGDLPGSMPVNISVTRFVDHSRLLPNVDCVVCNCGAGTTQAALAAGKPVVAIPFGTRLESDRYEIARRVQVSGCGVKLSSYRLSPGSLRKAVLAVLTPRYSEAARRMAVAFSRAGGASAAAFYIERDLL